MLYNLYFYKPVEESEDKDSANAVITDNVEFDSDAAALLYAAETVSEMNGDEELEDTTEEAVTEYLDSIDVKDGKSFCFAVTYENEDDEVVFAYGDQETFDKFTSEENTDDDKITEAVVNNPKITEFTSLKGEIAALEKELEKIKYDTSKVWDWEINDRILSFLSPEDTEKYQELKAEIEQTEKEIEELETQYKKVETKWFLSSSEDWDFDEIVTILDDKLEQELAPKVEELKKKARELNTILRDYQSKARTAYNADAANRRAASGFNDLVAKLDTLKGSKSKLLTEISEDPDFAEVIDWLKGEYKNSEVTDVGISDEGVYVEVDVHFNIRLDYDDFNDDGDLRFNEERIKEDIEWTINPSEPFVCEDTDAEFKLEVIDYGYENEPSYSEDYGIDEDLEAVGTVRATRVK